MYRCGETVAHATFSPGIEFGSMLLYVHRSHKAYYLRTAGAQDIHLDFHTASELCPDLVGKPQGLWPSNLTNNKRMTRLPNVLVAAKSKQNPGSPPPPPHTPLFLFRSVPAHVSPWYNPEIDWALKTSYLLTSYSLTSTEIFSSVPPVFVGKNLASATGPLSSISSQGTRQGVTD